MSRNMSEIQSICGATTSGLFFAGDRLREETNYYYNFARAKTSDSLGGGKIINPN